MMEAAVHRLPVSSSTTATLRFSPADQGSQRGEECEEFIAHCRAVVAHADASSPPNDEQRQKLFLVVLGLPQGLPWSSTMFAGSWARPSTQRRRRCGRNGSVAVACTSTATAIDHVDGYRVEVVEQRRIHPVRRSAAVVRQLAPMTTSMQLHAFGDRPAFAPARARQRWLSGQEQVHKDDLHPVEMDSAR